MITNVATEGNYLQEYFLNSNRFCLQIFVPNVEVTPIVVILIIFDVTSATLKACLGVLPVIVILVLNTTPQGNILT